jgi:uncharacterized membrane protein YGL010W
MRTIEQHITQYAAYHRDRRNIATHFVGVPLIVFSVVLALAQIYLGGIHAGWIGIAIAGTYYVYLDRLLGTLLVGFLVLCGAIASIISMKTGATQALVLALAIFVVGWIIQFIGHKYEGMKPAFMDDLMGLVIGPLFVTAEIAFIMRIKPQLQHYIEARVGPTLAARDGRPIGPRVSAESSTAHSNA